MPARSPLKPTAWDALVPATAHLVELILPGGRVEHLDVEPRPVVPILSLQLPVEARMMGRAVEREPLVLLEDGGHLVREVRAVPVEAQHERPSDQRDVRYVVIRGSFDPIEAWNRHAGADEHPLIAADGIAHRTEERAVFFQSAGPAQFLDQFERRVLHTFILLKRQSETRSSRHRRRPVTYRIRRLLPDLGVI